MKVLAAVACVALLFCAPAVVSADHSDSDIEEAVENIIALAESDLPGAIDDALELATHLFPDADLPTAAEVLAAVEEATP